MRMSTIMRALAGCVLLMLACASAWAQDSNQMWHWYYASPPYPNPGERPLLRFGTARVATGEGKIHINFAESDFPEMKATFEGRVAKGGDVRGELKNFFLQGPPVELPGQYRETKRGKGCQLQQIMLRTGFADGSILMLSRVRGECATEPDSDG